MFWNYVNRIILGISTTWYLVAGILVLIGLGGGILTISNFLYDILGDLLISYMFWMGGIGVCMYVAIGGAMVLWEFVPRKISISSETKTTDIDKL